MSDNLKKKKLDRKRISLKQKHEIVYYYILAGTKEFEKHLKRILDEDDFDSCKRCLMKIKTKSILGKAIRKKVKSIFKKLK